MVSGVESTLQGALPPLQVVDRLARVRVGIDAAGVDALLVTALANVRYLTGFSGSAGALLVTGRGALLVTDGRYRTQAAEQLTDAGVDGAVECAWGACRLNARPLPTRRGRERCGASGSKPTMSPGEPSGAGPRTSRRHSPFPPVAWWSCCAR